MRISAEIIILFVILLACSRIVLLNYSVQYYCKTFFLWDCRKKQILPNMYGFRANIIPKYKTGRKIRLRTKEFFMRKRILTPVSLLVLNSCL